MRKALFYTGGVLVVLAFVSFVAIAIPIQDRIGMWRRLPQLDHRLLPHLAALFAAGFGAFFGSLSAFYLGRVQQRADRREKRHAALIGAQYALISQWNIVEGIRLQHLEKWRSDASRFAKLTLFHAPVPAETVSFEHLTFVLEHDPNVLQDIHIAQQSYYACIGALSLRNAELERFYRNPHVAHHVTDLETGAGVSEARPEDVVLLKKATDSLYSTVDSALPKFRAAVQKLHDLIKTVFPKMKALRMTPIASGSDGEAP